MRGRGRFHGTVDLRLPYFPEVGDRRDIGGNHDHPSSSTYWLPNIKLSKPVGRNTYQQQGERTSVVAAVMLGVFQYELLSFRIPKRVMTCVKEIVGLFTNEGALGIVIRYSNISLPTQLWNLVS